MYLNFSVDLTHFVGEDDLPVLAEPVRFWARPFLEKEHRELMQTHFGLTEEQRKAKSHEYNVTLLSKIAKKAPAGLPGFPEKFDDLEKAVYDALIEKTEVNEILAEQLVGEHLAAGGNRYFFR